MGGGRAFSHGFSGYGGNERQARACILLRQRSELEKMSASYRECSPIGHGGLAIRRIEAMSRQQGNRAYEPGRTIGFFCWRSVT